ncbi:MAG: murein biosynthesis integral membrane protein MurJ [Candidatus Moraniibacteriota bacterium]|nr:MAG: murein biosynthesis integral membrane protein MurJ [Candidatus Moranbacteria bacterium]
MIVRITQFVTHSSRNSIAAGALVVSLFGIASRLLGLVRDRILASHYGAGDVLDIYYAAFRLPDFVFELLVVGSLGAAFIPVFSKLIAKKDREEAWDCANGVFVTIVFLITILAIMGIIFAPWLMHFIVPGFPEEKMVASAELARIMFLSPIFLAASSVLGGILVSFRRFIFYSMAPLFYNVGIIIGAVFFVPHIGLVGLAWGVVFGSFLHFFVNLIAAVSAGFRFRYLKSVPYKNTNVVQTMRLMAPRMFTSASNQISLLLITLFASTLAAGSLTVFTFAINIQSVVLGVIGVPFALAAFPVLSNKFAVGDTDAFVGVLSQTLRRILYYAVPLSIIFFVLREQIVRVVYGAGHFDIEDTVLTYQVLGTLCVSLFAQSVIPLLARGFYAMQNTKTPFYIVIASQVINVIMIISLIRFLGIYAIALAFSVTAVFNASILFVVLHRSFAEHEYRKTLRTAMQIAIATFVTFIVTFFSRNILGSFLPLQYVWGVLAQLVFSGLCGGLTYLFVTAIFEMREYETIKKKIIIRIFGRPQVATEQQNIAR